ncbi:hypothetical protein VCUG_00724 [Vavraia culicis subsp. floridensis]|uniref:C2H2-type domain-containing protein n=1 Tax=Vavraia culicis (isolate floridensis) TaxID=948595 RepID=L2GWU7_VAVCU|nr:uncharacterized protein VCUG_00724 [Vavraia culicis subsp. floridensis]ELA47763.1 hypothetical protein VCUG_00724 [Vavraia culicis subsp. floridensis]
MQKTIKPMNNKKAKLTDIDSLAHYRNEFYRNKKLYEINQYKMNRDQIVLENLLLNIEEDVLFKGRGEVSMDEVLESTEKRFLNNLDCCGNYFDTFNSFAQHRNFEHSNDEESAQDEAGTGRERECVGTGSTFSNMHNTINASSIANFNVSRSVGTEGVQADPLEKCKPYRCDITGCKKAYTSAYGLRYHIENGHVQKDDSNKPHICSFSNCGKRYKNSNGLKYHLEHFHKQ